MTTVTKQKIPTALNPPIARNAPPSDEPRTPPNRLLPLIMPTAVARDWPETSVAKVWNTGQPTLNTQTALNEMNTVTQMAGSIANSIRVVAPPANDQLATKLSRLRWLAMTPPQWQGSFADAQSVGIDEKSSQVTEYGIEGDALGDVG